VGTYHRLLDGLPLPGGQALADSTAKLNEILELAIELPGLFLQ